MPFRFAATGSARSSTGDTPSSSGSAGPAPAVPSSPNSTAWAPAKQPSSSSRLPHRLKIASRGWPAAAKLSHPHLEQILHYGRAEVDAGPVVYIVTDLAEELLSQIIPERPLSPDEARQMLTPILDALDYLHGKGFVHGHLKPSNILVVENDIKISSDALIPNGKHAPELLTNNIHIAPEVATGPISPRADIWSLGITLVEALTQELPIWDAATDTEPVLPASIPPPFAQIARRCLQPDPSLRCTIAQIRTLLERQTQTHSREASQKSLSPAQEDRPDKPLPSRMPFLPLLIGLVLLVAIIIGFRMYNRRTNTAPPQTESTPQAPPTPDSKTEQPQANSTTPVYSLQRRPGSVQQRNRRMER